MENCRCRRNDGAQGQESRAVVLNLRRANLDYSIRNYAYIESHTLQEQAECTKHLVADICEEGNRDRVTRLLELIHAEVVEMLYPMTKHQAVEEVVNDDFEEPKSYMITLEVPAAFSRTTVRLLGRLVHEYMVCRVLYDWLTIVNKASGSGAEHWLEKAQAAKEEINTIKHLRRGPLRRRLWPW